MRTVALVRVPPHDGNVRFGPGYEDAAIEGIARTSRTVGEVRVVRDARAPGGTLLRGWWGKLALFDPAADLPDEVFFLDLDIVFLRDLDRLLDAMEAVGTDIVGLSDYGRRMMASGIMLVRRRSPGARAVWEFARAHGWRHGSGDQDLIRAAAGTRCGLFPPELAPSYKVLAGKFPQAKHRPPGDAENAPVLVFHGIPTPADVASDPSAPLHALVRDRWRPEPVPYGCAGAAFAPPDVFRYPGGEGVLYRILQARKEEPICASS